LGTAVINDESGESMKVAVDAGVSIPELAFWAQGG